MTDCELTDEGEIECRELGTLTEAAEDALKKLSRRQALFVRHYLVELDAQKAHAAAGYSDSTRDSHAYRLLQNPAIADAIDTCLELKVERMAISADWIEQEYIGLYKEARHNKDRALARQCLKDLGEHHAMFVKVKVNVDSGDLEQRLRAGRERAARLKMVNGEQPAIIEHDGEQHPPQDQQTTSITPSTTDPEPAQIN